MLKRLVLIIIQPLSLPVYLLIFFLINTSFTLLCLQSGLEYLPAGPAQEIARSSSTLWNTGTFENQQYYDIFQDLITRSLNEQTSYWQDLFAATKSGRLVPAHAPLLSILAAPFYGLLGEIGFLLFNHLCSLCIATGIFYFCRNILKVRATPLLIILILFGTAYLKMTYAFSYDLFGAALMFSGILLVQNMPTLAAYLSSLAVFMRPTTLLLAPVLLFFPDRNQFQKQLFLRVAAGLALGTLTYLIFNNWLWGDFLTTERARMPLFNAGKIEWYGLEMNLSILTTDWFGKLFDPQYGLVPHALILLGLPLIFWNWREQPCKPLLLCVLLTGIIQALLIFSFHCWACSANGNRYLITCVFLILPFIYNEILKLLDQAARSDRPSSL